MAYLCEPGPRSSASCPGKMIWAWASHSVGRPSLSRRLHGRGDQTRPRLEPEKNISRHRKTVKVSPRLAEISPENTFQILITPFSRPVARSRLFLPLVGALIGRAPAAVFGGLGPKARPQTGWPQLKLLSPRSVSAFWLSLRQSVETF